MQAPQQAVGGMQHPDRIVRVCALPGRKGYVHPSPAGDQHQVLHPGARLCERDRPAADGMEISVRQRPRIQHREIRAVSGHHAHFPGQGEGGYAAQGKPVSHRGSLQERRKRTVRYAQDIKIKSHCHPGRCPVVVP